MLCPLIGRACSREFGINTPLLLAESKVLLKWRWQMQALRYSINVTTLLDGFSRHHDQNPQIPLTGYCPKAPSLNDQTSKLLAFPVCLP